LTGSRKRPRKGQDGLGSLKEDILDKSRLKPNATESAEKAREGGSFFRIKSRFRELGPADVPLLLAMFAVPLFPTETNGLAVRVIAQEALAALALLMLPFCGLRRFDWRLKGSRKAPDMYVFIWLLVVFLGIYTARNTGMATYKSGYILSLAVLYYCFSARINSHRKAFLFLVIAGIASCAVSIVEITAPHMASIFSTTAESKRLSSRSVLFIHSYLAAQYLLPVLVMIIAIVINKGQLLLRAAAGLLSLPVLGYLFSTGSRGTYLAALAALGLVLALRFIRSNENKGGAGLNKALWTALPIVLIAAGAVFLLSATGVLGSGGLLVSERVSSLFNPELVDFNFSRLNVWNSSILMSKDHFLLGVGQGNFSSVFPQYYLNVREIYHAHNQFLHILSENGAPGLLCFLGVLFILFGMMRKKTGAATGDNLSFSLHSGAAGALLAAGIYCFFETPIEWPASACFFLLPVSILLIPASGAVESEARTRPPWIVVAMVAGIAWILPGAGLVQAARSGVLGNEGYRLFAEKRYEDAVDELDRAARAWPWRAEIYACKADALVRLGRIQEALEAAKHSLELRPGVAKVLSTCTNCLFRLGRCKEVPGYLEEYILRLPRGKSQIAYFMLGKAFRKAGKLEAALVVFNNLYSMKFIPPSKPDLLLELAKTMITLKRDPLTILTLLTKANERAGREQHQLEEILDLLDEMKRLLEMDEELLRRCARVKKMVDKQLETKEEQ